MAGRTWPAVLRDRRAPVARLVLATPRLVYRAGLGRLLGHQFLLLMHVGRRTGRVRETVLKVLRYDPMTHESVVAAAWGSGTDWLRNIEAHPAVLIESGGERYVPCQRVLEPDEAGVVFADWTRRQRRFARVMLAQLG